MQKNNPQILPNFKEISKVLKYKKQDFDKLLKDYIGAKKKIYTEIKSIKKEDRNFENTILALENSGSEFTDKFFQINTFTVTHKDKNFRDLASEFQKFNAESMVDIEHDKDIFRSVKEYVEGNYKKEKRNLDNKYGAGSVKLVEDTYKDYKRMGFDLPKAKQEKLKKNSKELSKLAIDFSKNIDEYKDFILCSKEELKGLPETFINTLEKVKDGSVDKYKITLDYPNLIPFLQYADSREKRKELADKNAKKGGKENLKILANMVKLRDANAKILGYKNHVEFTVEDRMAKNEKNIRVFLSGIMNKLKPLAKKESEELNNFAKNNLENYKDVKRLEYFDLAYVENKLKEKTYSIDSAKIKEYFELENVLNQMFNIFGNLFDFTAREIDEKEKKEKGISLADKEVRIFEFKDKRSKEIISYLILDLFPRDGKYGHACSSEFIVGGFKDDKRAVPVNEIICNFQKPNKNLPSLLTLRDVETVFHEFGHALHFMFTKAKHVSQAGYNTVWDFVETPSQFMENFLYEEDNLKKIAVHYKTKKALDKETINKIIKSKNFLNCGTTLSQSIVTLLDIELHSNNIKLGNGGLDIAKEYINLRKKYSDLEISKVSIFPAGLGHLAHGYDAGYYSYMWALVYAQDFYSEFKKVKGDKSAFAKASVRHSKLKEIGERYRKEILEVGGSREEMESVKKFLGRLPNNKAFLEEIGAN